MEKKLHKGTDRKIAGVCSGFAQYFGLDVTWVRIGWAFISCIYGTGILIYIIAAFVMPNE